MESMPWTGHMHIIEATLQPICRPLSQSVNSMLSLAHFLPDITPLLISSISKSCSIEPLMYGRLSDHTMRCIGLEVRQLALCLWGCQ